MATQAIASIILLASWVASSASQSFTQTWTWNSSASNISPFFVYINNNAAVCGTQCVRATIGLSVDAARNQIPPGANQGIRLNITKKSNSPGDVLVASPRFVLDAGRYASWCFEAKHNTPGAVLSLIGLRHTAQAVTGIFMRKDMQFNSVNVWQQFCISEMEFLIRSVFSVVITAGSSKGVLDMDQFALNVTTPLDANMTATWLNRTAQNERIRENRRGNLTFLFVDALTNQPVTQLSSLSVVLKSHDFLFGTAYAPEALRVNDWSRTEVQDWYMATTAAFGFNAVVPENLYKWPVYEPAKGVFQNNQNTFYVDYFQWATANGIAHIRGHPLEWYYAPFNSHWSRLAGCNKYLEYVYARIKRDVQNMGVNFKSYDVINELLNEFSYYRTCNFTLNVIADMFKIAKSSSAAPDTTLFCINDYRILDGDLYTDYIKMIQDLIALGAPVNCIAVQAHLTFGTVSYASIKRRLDTLATLGLPIYISEASLRTGYDVPTGTFLNTLDDTTQALWLEDLYRIWFSHPAVKGIMLWGWWDKLHFIQGGGIYDMKGRPKPAAYHLAGLQRVAWNTSVVVDRPFSLASSGKARMFGFYGSYQVKLKTAAGKAYSFLVEFSASKGPNQVATIRLPSAAT